MVNKEIRDYIAETNEEAVLFDNPSFDGSISGISTTGRVIYVYEKMVAELAAEDNISWEEAEDFINYNTLRAIPYCDSEYAPIVMEEGAIPYIQNQTEGENE